MFDPSRFDYTGEEIAAAAAADRLLSLELEFSRRCNYRCPYCYTGTAEPAPDELSAAELDDVIGQAAELGARKIVILGGEPLLVPGLFDHLERIRELGLGAEIFTNGSLITAETAARLYAADARVVVKLNSLQPEVQDRLTGRPGSLARVMRSIEWLQRAGFDSPERLGASTVISNDNIGELAGLWRYLVERRIDPYFEMLTPQGRLLDHPELGVAPARVRELFEELSRYDAGRGRHWEPQPPLVGASCFRHLYSCVVTATGRVMPCVGVTVELGNVRETPLGEILRESSVLRDLKDYRNRIKEPCAGCEKREHCYGCRGAAYQLTGDYLAADPLCWRNEAKREQIAVLPVPLAPLLPHRAPAAFPGSLVAVGARSVAEVTIPPDSPYGETTGELVPAALVELAAQVAAAADAFRHRGKSRPGLLVEAREVQFYATVRVGERLRIEVMETANFDCWYLVRFRIEREGAAVAGGGLKLCVAE